MPTKAELVYLTPAIQDMEEIMKFHLNSVGPASARNVYETMKTALSHLRDFPLMGQTHPDPLLAAQSFRKLVLTKTYVAIYKVEGNTVVIYRVVNGLTDYPRLLR